MLYGRALADKIISGLDGTGKYLVIVQVGDNPDSNKYIKYKKIACEKCKVKVTHLRLPETISKEEFISHIKRLNQDTAITAILIQLPLPSYLPYNIVAPEKDVDGLNPHSNYTPATALAVMELIKSTNIPISGKHAVVLGRSRLVGSPTALLLMEQNCTVTICHSKTINLDFFLKHADIIVAATGMPNLVQPHHLTGDTIVINVGSVDVSNKCMGKFISPPIGGVGPLTIACLLSNVCSM